MKTSRAVLARWSPLIILALTLSSCGGGGGNSSVPTCPNECPYSVGGTVTGLATGNSVVLLNNGGDATTVNTNTTFTFATAVGAFKQYAVTVGTQPAGQTCTVSGGSGSSATTPVTDVSVICGPKAVSSLELLLATNSSVGSISAFTTNTSNGALTLIQGSPFGGPASASSIAIDPAKRFAFCLTSGGGYIVVFTIDPASGALTQIAGGPYPTGATPTAITVDPNSHFVFTANSSGNSVSAFSISASGTLTEVSGSPFPVGSEPSAVAFEPHGKFLYVANAGDNTVSAYAMNPTTGQLTAVVTSPYPTGGVDPRSIAIDPLGVSLYVANLSSSTISGFEIGGASGALGTIPGSPFSNGGGTALVVDRTGGYVYAAGGANVAGFARDQNTGVLTQLADSPFPGGPNATSIAVDASGGYLYVLDNVLDEVRGFSIDKNTGALSAVAGSPFALVPGQQALGPTVIVTSQ